MEKQGVRILISILLIVFGVLALLSNLNILPIDLENNNVLMGALFGFLGLGFVAVFAGNMRENWWAVIPGFTLIGLALLIGFERMLGEWGGAVFLGSIGLSFWVIFAIHSREHWWAIIPGGALVTLAAVVIASSSSMDGNGFFSGGILFIGLALTFVAVYALTRQSWAIWPAAVLGVLGMLVLTGAGVWASLVWPAALILVGGWLIFRALRPSARG
jgi:hypothetical protein